MAESVSITPEAPVNKGADYAWLKEEGTRLVQQLSGAIWTDYNEHDPGVTTLEQLCYALTELSYRSEFKLADLLTDPRSGRIDTRRQALFVPRRILPSAPVTLDDYRKLIIDRVLGVANVWLIPRPDLSPAAVDGLYDIAIYAPGADPCACDDDSYLLPATICARVRRVYCAWRNLCEDVADIGLLDLLPTVVAGTVVVGDRFTAETILARLLFNLGNFLAPEPRRLPLKALVDAGLGSEAIFEGPLLRNGFIADTELEPKAPAIVLRDVIRVMARSPGVMSVRGVSVTMGERTASGSDATLIPIPETGIPYLETKPVDGAYPIKLVRNGIEIKPDPARVARELGQLWADQRRTYPLARQYLDYFAVPRGQYRDVETYTSIQNQYPNAYGINSFGLPPDSTVVRKAQAKQLKGYLLAFEQLLADFFAQLAHLRVLYSTDELVTQTYFYQFLGASVPDVAELLQPEFRYRAGLAKIVHDSDPVVARRNRFLDLLLALYAERLDAGLMPFLPQGTSAAELLRAKLALLHHLVRATRDRGLGFDYLAIATPRNVAGMEIATRIELGMPPFARRPLADQLEEIGLSLVDDDTQASIGTPLTAHGAIIDDSFTPYAAFDEPRGAGDPESIEQSAAMLRGQRATLSFLRGFATGGEIRLGTLPDDDLVALVSRAPGEPDWRLAGTFAGRARALAAADRLATLAENLIAAVRQLYIVEHTLLRFGRWHAETHGSPPDAPEPFVYSFTVTAVLSAGPEGIDPQEYRTGVREVIRRNTPAHIVIEYAFLRPRRMARFERLYRSWQQALRRGDPVRIAITSRTLTAFLVHQVTDREAASAESGVIDRDEEQS